jgi:hypothetical protein
MLIGKIGLFLRGWQLAAKFAKPAGFSRSRYSDETPSGNYLAYTGGGHSSRLLQSVIAVRILAWTSTLSP